MSGCGVTVFPLFQRVQEAGVLESGNALIVAPTGTGKSYIGRAILHGAVRRGEPGVHAYLVPYRALANEMYDSFRRELEGTAMDVRLRVATGDYADPIHPHETDILIATYERFASLLGLPDLNVGRVVVDEIHLVADETRGPVVEGLLARMKAHKRPASLCALSAVVADPEELAKWLGVPVFLGEPVDRAVGVEFHCQVVDDVNGKLVEEIGAILDHGEQAVVFCRSKAASQAVARNLRPLVTGSLSDPDERALRDLAVSMAEDDEEAEELLALFSGGVAFHHAGLSRDSRMAVETAFREHHLKVIACTPTLAAGVNLPAGLVVVRDVYRTEFARGYPRQVTLSTGELLNMLGRAGRPGQVQRGRGVALVETGFLHPDELSQLQGAISEGRGNPVTSRLPDSFDSLMHFLLAVTADRGEATLSDLAQAVRETLWYFERPTEIDFTRPFQADIMEDIPSFARVGQDMRVERAWPVADGVAGRVVSGPKIYDFSLRLSGEDCSCPARSRWRRQDVCKHLACAIHHLLFGPDVDAETRSRAIYASAHRFRNTLDLGTKIRVARDLLVYWGLLELVPGGFRVTTVGTLAANSGVDLLLIRTAHDRLRKLPDVPSPKDVARWIIEDYFSEESKRNRWLQAAEPWLAEVDRGRIKLPEKYRGDFERGLEDLGRLASLYGEIAASLGRPDVGEVCRLARGCLQYGVSAELIPLASLRIPQLGRARCRFLFDSRGIRGLDDLAAADPEQLTGPRVPLALAKQWVETARQMRQARNRVAAAAAEERGREVDEFLTRFRVDQLALFGERGLLGEATAP